MPPKQSTVTVTISADKENEYIEAPTFLKPLYRGLLFGNGSFALDEEISIVPKTFDDHITFALLGGNRKQIFRASNKIKL